MAVAEKTKRRRTPVAEKVKKHRVLDEFGKWRWVPIDTGFASSEGEDTEVFPRPLERLPVYNPQAQIIADVGDPERGPQLDWDGNEVEEFDGEYDDYIESMPPREQLRLFNVPHCYWEVRYPGCALQPYPRMGEFRSLHSGTWEARNPAQETAIREHIAQTTGVDPDTLRITPEDLAVMDGRASGSIRYCQDGACHFVSCSLLACDLHEKLAGHTTKSTPRKD